MGFVQTAEFYIQLLISLTLGLLYSVISVGYMLITAVKTKGAALSVKNRDKRPACLTDPSLGEHKFIYLEDVKLHYVVSGPEDKPLMLLVHGFPEFWYSWRYQIREFSNDYRVVAVDQRGYNQSEKPEGRHNYSMCNLIKDLKELIHALGYDECVLVGHDWGGAVVWSFAMEYPHMLDKLIVMNAPHLGVFRDFIKTSWTQFKMSWYISYFQIPFVPEISCWFNDFKLLEWFFNGTTGGIRSGKLEKEDMEAYKYAFSSKGGFTGPINYYRALIWQIGGAVTLRRMEKPTLLLWGDDDFALHPKLADLHGEFVSDLTVKHIADCSHWIQIDKPDIVNKHMREFLKGGNE